jgi:hypothetical protein
VKLKKSIKVGEILTIITILVSVATLLYSQYRDREIRLREQAARTRNAAGKTFAMLQRWQSLNLSLFDELQPVFVETTEVLVKKHDIKETQDFLWKNINTCEAKIADKIMDEGIEIAYSDLLVNLPKYRSFFMKQDETLQIMRKNTIDEFLVEIQNNVTSAKNSEGIVELRNTLRKTAERFKQDFKKKTDNILEHINEILFDVINKKDKEIVEVLPNQPEKVIKAKNPFE